MRRLIWGFAGCTYHIVGNLMPRLISHILSQDRSSYLTHVVLPRLSREGWTSVVLELAYMVVKRRHCYEKVASSCEIASQHFQGLQEAYFKIKSQWWVRKRIHYLCEGRIQKFVPQDHRLSSLSMPRDAICDPRAGFFYPTLTSIFWGLCRNQKHAHLQTITIAATKFQKDWYKPLPPV